MKFGMKGPLAREKLTSLEVGKGIKFDPKYKSTFLNECNDLKLFHGFMFKGGFTEDKKFYWIQRTQ